MNDLMVKILQQIRDELKSTRADLSSRLDETNSRLDGTNRHLETTNSRLTRLEQRQVETEVRLSTEIVAVASAIGELKTVLIEDRKLRTQVSDHETRLKRLERKPLG